jgi:N-acetylglucosaminyl-diphospho-decaprenol L-rhamnosyltransferase
MVRCDSRVTPTLVALVIPVYRGWEHVERLIADLEPLPAWLSIHVVDDASGDRGGEVLLGAHPDIHLVTRVENGGFGASVNTGVANATSADVLVIVNSDLRITVETVRCLAQVAAEQHVIVGPHTVRLNHESVAVGHRFPTLWSYAQELFLVTRGIRNLRRRLSVNPQETGVVYVDWIIGSCLAFDRTLWERIGPIDEGFHMYSEEIDWQRRANALGIGSCWLPQLQVSHDEITVRP